MSQAVSTRDPARAATQSPGAAGQEAHGTNLQLKQALLGKSYADQAAMLSPSAQMPVQKEEGGDTGAAAEVRAKLNAHLESFGGNEAAFKAYSSDGTTAGTVDKAAAERILKDAGISWAMRKLALPTVMEEFDANADAKVTYDEFTTRMDAGE